MDANVKEENASVFFHAWSAQQLFDFSKYNALVKVIAVIPLPFSLKKDTQLKSYHQITNFAILKYNWAVLRIILENLKYSVICHFHASAIVRRRKVWYHLRVSRILFAAQNLCPKQLDDFAHEQIIICRSRGGLSANEKDE